LKYGNNVHWKIVLDLIAQNLEMLMFFFIFLKE
jgi:hypothetical protein